MLPSPSHQLFYSTTSPHNERQALGPFLANLGKIFRLPQAMGYDRRNKRMQHLPGLLVRGLITLGEANQHAIEKKNDAVSNTERSQWKGNEVPRQ